MKIETAKLDWQQVDGIEIPVSRQFGDVYFSKDNGLLETRHVFLNGNDLTERLSQLHDYQYFCVGETGFGTGLNVLALWQLWRQVRPNNHSRLHVVSIEKYPLTQDDLRRALSVWHELGELSALLIKQYPLPIAGCHRLVFADERFSLDLWLGDASDVLPQISSYRPIDAWFLDGFAPACNPDFWQEHILKHIVRLSAAGTTFASFTVAGVVKRGLAQYGITIQRPKGFGRKREMLKAVWQANGAPLHTSTTRKIAVIGAGIAGLSCAYALAQRGYQVDLLDKTSPLAGASGNPLALLNPKLCDIQQVSGHLMMQSWLYATRYYQQFQAYRPLTVQQIQPKATTNQLQIDDYPPKMLSTHPLGLLQSTSQSLNLHGAGAVEPHRLATAILNHHHIHFIKQDVDEIIIQENQQLNVMYQHQLIATYDHVIVCTALNSSLLINSLPTLKPIRGQVSWCKQSLFPIDLAYSYGGYMAQFDETTLLLGASFYPNRTDDEVLEEDHQHNYHLMQAIFPTVASTLAPIEQWQGRASIRAQSADYFPLVGKAHETAELYTLSGLGSKGFLFAPFCAELLVAQLLGEVVAMPHELAQKLRPHRFKKRRKT